MTTRRDEMRLTITAHAIRLASEALRPLPARRLVVPAGFSQLGDGCEYLVHRFDPSTPDDRRGAPVGNSLPRNVILSGAASAADFRAQAMRVPWLIDARQPAVLVLGVGSQRGFVAGYCRRRDGQITEFDSIRIVGPGLPGTSRTPSQQSESTAEQEIWSRTIGALGLPTWQRLTSLHMVVVGCGRSGSMLVAGLQQLGVRRLTVIDPDRLEPHNLGEMAGLDLTDVTRHKVTAVTQRLHQQALFAETSAKAVPDPITSMTALAAVKSADVLFGCVDNISARRSISFLATTYLKPLIDLGTGILNSSTSPQRRGADIRLIFPGCCLHRLGGLSFGGLARPNDSVTEDEGASRGRNPHSRSWNAERAGSLRSLNGVAVHLGLRLLEDFVAGVVREPVWLQ